MGVSTKIIPTQSDEMRCCDCDRPDTQKSDDLQPPLLHFLYTSFLMLDQFMHILVA